MQSEISLKKLEAKKNQAYAVKATKSLKAGNPVDLTKRTITGFYNTFNFLDDANDMILPGAFNRSLKAHGVDAPEGNYRIKHLLFHDWTKVLSVPSVLEERIVTVDGKEVKGLYYETPIPNTTDGDDTLIKYQEGIYDQHSIGYQYLDGEYVERGSADWDRYTKMLVNPEAVEDKNYFFVWKEIKLFEGSTVAFGCNELTPYLGVKSENVEGLAFKIIGKIDIIQKQLSSGKISDDAVFNLNMQAAQLKQYIAELFTDVPDLKDTLKSKKAHAKESEQPTSRFARIGKQLID